VVGGKSKNLRTGSKGEELAAEMLANQGYEILVRNYREKYGEVDIVAKLGRGSEEYIVFVEVKTKTEDMYGEPWEMINKHKLKQITQMGHLWCLENHYHGLVRIDVVGVWLDVSGEVKRIEHWENVQM
jgi:putative endonuclease